MKKITRGFLEVFSIILSLKKQQRSKIVKVKLVQKSSKYRILLINLINHGNMFLILPIYNGFLKRARVLKSNTRDNS